MGSPWVGSNQTVNVPAPGFAYSKSPRDPLLGLDRLALNVAASSIHARDKCKNEKHEEDAVFKHSSSCTGGRSADLTFEGGRCRFLPVDRHLLMGASCRVGLESKSLASPPTIQSIPYLREGRLLDIRLWGYQAPDPFETSPSSVHQKAIPGFKDDPAELYRLNRMEAK